MRKLIGHEQAFQRRKDPSKHKRDCPLRSCAVGTVSQKPVSGMSLPDAKRLKEFEAGNGHLKKLLAESLLEMEVTREAQRKKW